MRTLSITLAARGHDVAVVTMRHKHQAKIEIDQGVRVYRIHASIQRLPWLFSDSGRQYTPPFPDPEMTLELRHIILREKPHIVHAHNWLVRSFLPLKEWSGARLIVTLHDYNLVCATDALMYHDAPCDGPSITKCLGCAARHYGIVKGIPTVLSNWIMGLAEQRVVDRFLAVSQAVAVGNGLVDSKLPFQVIPNFLPDSVSLPQRDSTAYLAQLPSEDYILFVGALGRAKGVDVLLQAYSGLRDAPPLVLIGYQTPDWSLLASKCSHNIFALKNWPHDAVMQAWRRSLIAVAPSVWPEPCSTVVMEAMLLGRPVIATRIGGMTDLVADGETGFLVKPGDVAALQYAIEQLLEHASLRKEMGLAAQRKVVDFQVSTVIPHIERVYREILSA
ncbi:MAG: hypothetical protein PVS3B3_03560 [Ktedonobacteraceae bacterium]